VKRICLLLAALMASTSMGLVGEPCLQAGHAGDEPAVHDLVGGFVHDLSADDLHLIQPCTSPTDEAATHASCCSCLCHVPGLAAHDALVRPPERASLLARSSPPTIPAAPPREHFRPPRTC
jgi:hypothetical protein